MVFHIEGERLAFGRWASFQEDTPFAGTDDGLKISGPLKIPEPGRGDASSV
jgi:hypothetical protein